jgi:hypothetical protein
LYLDKLEAYSGLVATKRSPDLLIRGNWALEFKIARPFGDNGKPAENWSVNLLHPYPGNVSAIGDCIKLASSSGIERKGVIVIGYEHSPSQISLDTLIGAFEVIARNVADIDLAPRVETSCGGLIHPVHQVARVFGWEVLGRR